MSSGATLIAGVGVLLLAIGLGVLIGRLGHNNTSTPRASAPSTIIVPGASAGATTASTPTSTVARSTPHLSGKLKKAAAATAPPSAAVSKKGQAAASKVLGGSSTTLAPATVTNGQTCTSGAGCQGGKFTGNFFGQ